MPDMMRNTLLSTSLLLALAGCQHAAPNRANAEEHAAAGEASAQADKGKAGVAGKSEGDKVVKTDAEWRKVLTPEQYNILRQKGTERAFTGAFYDSHVRATYVCAACNLPLFRSEEKFDSGTGWPSFWQPIAKEAVDTDTDGTLGMARTEVKCHRCGGHLGHVFDDGPKPTGLRYCINSAALKQEKR